jgi:hypothetical protein
MRVPNSIFTFFLGKSKKAGDSCFQKGVIFTPLGVIFTPF